MREIVFRAWWKDDNTLVDTGDNMKKSKLDDILLQEIFSLREKLRIAIDYIKFYNPEFDEKDFIHQVGSVEYDQWIEELTEGELR